MTATYADPKVVLAEGRRRLRECGPTILAVMKHLDVTTRALAEMLEGESWRATLTSRLRGKTSFEQPEVDAIAVALGVPTDVLLGDWRDAVRYLLDNPEPPAGATPLAEYRAERRSRARSEAPGRWSAILPLHSPDRAPRKVAA